MERQLQYALITGASSGIGKAYALYLAKQTDMSLILVARRYQLLEELKSEIYQIWRDAKNESSDRSVEVIKADLLSSDDLDRLSEVIDRRCSELELLINCAGFATLGRFADSDIDKEQAMLDLNCSVPIKLSRWVLPGMIARKKGLIINVSSIGAFQPAPFMAVYAASKAFLLNFNMALNQELAGTGVSAFAHCPGPTKTEFHLVAGLPEDMSPLPPMSSDDAVREVFKSVGRKSAYLVNGMANRWLVRLGRFLSLERSAKAAEKMLLSRWTPP